MRAARSSKTSDNTSGCEPSESAITAADDRKVSGTLQREKQVEREVQKLCAPRTIYCLRAHSSEMVASTLKAIEEAIRLHPGTVKEFNVYLEGVGSKEEKARRGLIINDLFSRPADDETWNSAYQQLFGLTEAEFETLLAVLQGVDSEEPRELPLKLQLIVTEGISAREELIVNLELSLRNARVLSSLRHLARTFKAEMHVHFIDICKEDELFSLCVDSLQADRDLSLTLASIQWPLVKVIERAEFENSIFSKVSDTLSIRGLLIKARNAVVMNQLEAAQDFEGNINLVLVGAAHVEVSRGISGSDHQRVVSIVPEKFYQKIPPLYRSTLVGNIADEKSLKATADLKLSVLDIKDFLISSGMEVVLNKRYPELRSRYLDEQDRQIGLKFPEIDSFLCSVIINQLPTELKEQIYEDVYKMHGPKINSFKDALCASVEKWLARELKKADSSYIPKWIRDIFSEIEAERG